MHPSGLEGLSGYQALGIENKFPVLIIQISVWLPGRLADGNN